MNDGFEFKIEIDQARMVAWDLTFKEAALLSYIKQAHTRFKQSEHGVWLSKKVVLRDMPCLTHKQDSLQRIERGLVQKGLLIKTQVGVRLWHQLTDKSRAWGLTTSDSDIRLVREKSPEVILNQGGKKVVLSSVREDVDTVVENSLPDDDSGSEKVTTVSAEGSEKVTTEGSEKVTTKQLTNNNLQEKNNKQENPPNTATPKKIKPDPAILAGNCQRAHKVCRCKQCKTSVTRLRVNSKQLWGPQKFFDIPSNGTLFERWSEFNTDHSVESILDEIKISVKRGEFKEGQLKAFSSVIEDAIITLDFKEART